MLHFCIFDISQQMMNHKTELNQGSIRIRPLQFRANRFSQEDEHLDNFDWRRWIQEILMNYQLDFESQNRQT
jgi:hypothetical protein